MAITDLAQSVAENGAALRGGSPRCCVCNAVDDLPEVESAALVSLLSNPQVRYTELSAALTADEDYPLDLHPDALRKHCRGRCSSRTVLRAVTR